MGARLDVTLDELRRQRQGVKWTLYGPDAIPSWVADMDFPVAEPIKRAIADYLERDDLGYPPLDQFLRLRETFAARMSERYGWEPDPRGVRAVDDLIQPMFSTVATFSEPGEGVVLQTPLYYPFFDVVEELARRRVENRLVAWGGRFEMDLDGLRTVVDAETRILMLCNPHNPTGRVFERSELEGVAEVALRHDLVVVADEVHADLVFAPHRHVPFASLGPEIAERTITLTSATKAFNIAGVKCALVHFGSKALSDRHAERFHPRVLGGPGVLGVAATLAAWREGDEWLAAVTRQLDENRHRIAHFLAERLPGVVYHQPEASYLAWLDCSALELPERPYDFFLAEAGVALHDGRKFSAIADHFVRLNYATSPAVLDEVLERMAAAAAAARNR
jgi:cystathionine beta-lyase